MKKIFLILLTILSLRSFSQSPQTPNINQTFGSPTSGTLTKGLPVSDSGYWYRFSFPDTLTASNGLLKNCPGVIIRVINDFYARSNDISKWNLIGAGTVTGASNGVKLVGTTIQLGGEITTAARIFGNQSVSDQLSIDSLRNFTITTDNQSRLGISSSTKASVLSSGVTSGLYSTLSLDPHTAIMYGVDSTLIGINGNTVTYYKAFPHLIYAASDSAILFGSNSADQYARDSLVWRTQNSNTAWRIFPDSMSFWQKTGDYYIWGMNKLSDSTGTDIMVKNRTTNEWSTIPANSLGINKSIVGAWDSTTFSSNSLPTNWTTFGVTPTFSGGMVLAAVSGTTIPAHFVYSQNYSATQNYVLHDYFTVNTKPANNADGYYFGKRSGNTGQQCQHAFVLRTNDAGTHGYIVTTILYNTTETRVDSTPLLTLTNGDKYHIIVGESTTGIYVQFQHLTAGGVVSEYAESFYKYTTIATDLLQPCNTGAVWIGVIGTTGNYTTTNIYDTHYDVIHPNVAFIGNSIGVRYNATSLKNLFSNMAMSGTNKYYANLSGGGDRLIEYLLRFNEIKTVAPQYAIIECGTNDLAADIRSGLTSLIDSCQAYGIIPIVLKLFSTAAKDSVVFNVCIEQGVKLVDCHTSNIVPPTTDGAHLTDLGEQKVLYILRASCPEVFGFTGNWELPTLQGMGDVNGSPSNGTSPVWNSTTRQFDWTAASGLTIGTTPISGGSAGQIPYHGAGNVIQESSNLFWDNTNGRLSIRQGTSPQDGVDINASGLMVRGATAGTSGAMTQVGYITGSDYGVVRALNWTGTVWKDLRLGNDAVIVKANKTIGIGLTGTLSGWVDIAAGTTALSQIHYTSSSLVSTIAAGNSSYNGNYYFSNVSLNQLGFGGSIKDFGADSSNTGTSEEFLYRYTTKVNSLNADGEKLTYHFTVNLSDATADKVVKFYFAGIQCYTSGTLTATTGTFGFDVYVIRTSSSTARVTVNVASGTTAGAAAAASTETDLTGLTFSNAYALVPSVTVSGAGGGAGDATFKMGSIYFYPAANN